MPKILSSVLSGAPKTNTSIAPHVNGIVSEAQATLSPQNVPQWVCAILDAPSDQIVSVHIEKPAAAFRNIFGTPVLPHSHLYPVLLEYFAYFAVNSGESSEPSDAASPDDAKTLDRQVKGRLSSLWYTAVKNTVRSAGRSKTKTSSKKKAKQARPPTAEFHFGLGTARVQIEGKDVCIEHTSTGPPVAIDGRPTTLKEIFLWARDAETLKLLCDVAFKWNFERKKRSTPAIGTYDLYTLSVQGGEVYWNSEGLKASRSLKSVVLPKGMLDEILQDFREFSADDAEEWYIAHGLPHRRSYLFHGPPGVGKTSTIRALAGALDLSACFLSLGDCDIGNKQLQSALRKMPKPGMLVIEDIDALFNEDRQNKNPSALTFSGLLNSLDGLVSADGILTVMTTNHLEKLDPALVRAGRVDRRFEFKAPTREQIADLFLSFYPKASPELCKEFADAVFKRKEKDARNIATLQEHFIFTRRKSARESIDGLQDFFTRFYPNGKSSQGFSIYA